MEGQNLLLEVTGLNAGYGTLQALWDINIKVESCAFVSIIGANGAGKSTLVKAICGLLPLYSGTVTFNGEDITKKPPYQRTKDRLTLIPDERGLFPDMTVMENLRMGGYTVDDKHKIDEAIEWGFTEFPILKKRAAQNAGSLSGGEQQMLAMAKAMVNQPKLLILDEPSSGLAPIIIDQMFHVLESIQARGVTVLLVEQNVRRTLNSSDYCYVLENGRIALEGPSEELKNDDSVKELYLGL